MEHYDLVTMISDTTIPMIATPQLWEQFDVAKFGFISDKSIWHTFKFLKDDDSLSDEYNNIDRTKGGIYVFYINPNCIPDLHRYLMYIGRAQITTTQNIKKRVKEYYDKHIIRNDGYLERPKVDRLFHFWKSYIHVAYLLLDDNDKIKKLEAELINRIKPPCNDEIPDRVTRKAVTASF